MMMLASSRSSDLASVGYDKLAHSEMEVLAMGIQSVLTTFCGQGRLDLTPRRLTSSSRQRRPTKLVTFPVAISVSSLSAWDEEGQIESTQPVELN